MGSIISQYLDLVHQWARGPEPPWLLDQRRYVSRDDYLRWKPLKAKFRAFIRLKIWQTPKKFTRKRARGRTLPGRACRGPPGAVDVLPERSGK